MRLHELTFCAAGVTRLMLTGEPVPPGLHAMADAADAFVWRLDAPCAAAFAALVEGLAVASRKAGSELLECGIEEGRKSRLRSPAGSTPRISRLLEGIGSVA